MQRFYPGHKFSAKERTADVWTEEQVDFESLLLSPLILKGLTDSGFEKPSPIQLKAIPLGRCGLDLIAQAKSGTGKTCVFSVIALENVLIENPATQVLVLAPTREIAVQIKDVVNAIGCHMKGLSCQVFIGGLPVDDDKKALKGCQIAVGSPGRIKNLIENKHLKTDSIRIFILDEADKLLDESFQEQINWIFSTLPTNKQMMAFSATYPEYLANHLTRYMREPTFVRLNAADPTLQGIKQFYHVVPFHQLPHKIFQEKVEHLLKLLSKVNFHQCLLFSNFQIRAQRLSSTLCAKGWPATFIAGSQTQEKRLQAMEKLKAFKCRILISTDLTARGIDAENVNLVINMDVPRDGETYLHRIGRAGRFGTKGVAVTFVAKGKEEEKFREIEKSIDIRMEALPDHIPDSLMISDSLLGPKEVQVKKDRVEVNVLHKSTTATKDKEESARSLIMSNEEENVSNGPEGPVNYYKQNNMELNATCEYSNTSVHERENLSPEIACVGSNGTVLVGSKSETPDKGAEGSMNQAMKSPLKENGLSAKQGKLDGLPSLEEFEKDFEEYLALASTFKNIDLQDQGENVHSSQAAVFTVNIDGEDSKQVKGTCDITMHNNIGYHEFDDYKLKNDEKLDEIAHISSTCGGTARVDDEDNDDNTSSADEDDSGDDDSDTGDEEVNSDDDDDDESGNATDENDQNSIAKCTKDLSHFSNVIFKSSRKDKNYNDTETVDIEQSDSNQQASDDDDDDVPSDESDNAVVIDNDDDDDDYYSEDSDVGINNRTDKGDNKKDYDNNHANYNGLGDMQCTTTAYHNSIETFYCNTEHGISQGFEPTAQYQQYSTPVYQWNGKYPDNYKAEHPQGSLVHYPGMSPWQQVPYMPDKTRQAASGGTKMSGLLDHSRSQMKNTGDMENQSAAVDPGYTGVHSPMHADNLIQNSDTSWSIAWHNAYCQLNNAIKQFAALNSRTY